jgi:hypothetical protein
MLDITAGGCDGSDVVFARLSPEADALLHPVSPHYSI